MGGRSTGKRYVIIFKCWLGDMSIYDDTVKINYPVVGQCRGKTTYGPGAVLEMTYSVYEASLVPSHYSGSDVTPYLSVLVKAALTKAVGEDEADEGGVDAVAASAHLDIPVHLDGHLDEVGLHVHGAVDGRHADRLRS